MIKGTVTISLEDYNKLVEKNKITSAKEDHVHRTAKELAVFLSYLASRENMDRYIEQFNIQSKTSKIKFEGNKAVIEFRDVKD
tara:strand:- start:21 stop:269 length:249 start_codon:yes stop_codon:yes gene_type:complete